MSVATPNVYGPGQIAGLQGVFEQVWAAIGYARVVSRDDLAKLIVALAADGGAEDRNEIDVEKMSEEVLATVVRLMQHEAWSGQSRLRAFNSMRVSDNWATAQASSAR
jgi:hypothetical protein